MSDIEIPSQDQPRRRLPLATFAVALGNLDGERMRAARDDFPILTARQAMQESIEEEIAQAERSLTERHQERVASGRYSPDQLTQALNKERDLLNSLIGREPSTSAMSASPPAESANAEIPVTEQVVDRPDESDPGSFPRGPGGRAPEVAGLPAAAETGANRSMPSTDMAADRNEFEATNSNDNDLARNANNPAASEATEGGERWLTIAEAARISDANPGVISRAATERTLRSNGKKGRGRRIDAVDFSRWQLERVRKPEAKESPEAVQAKLQRASR